MTIITTMIGIILTMKTLTVLLEDVKHVSTIHALNANQINMARKNIFLSMEDVMNLIIIQMMIVTRLIQMKNGMIIKIIMRKVKFLMVVENTNVKLDAKFAIVLLILQSVQLVWMDSL